MKKLLVTTALVAITSTSAYAAPHVPTVGFDTAATIRDSLNNVYTSFDGNFADLSSTIPLTNNGNAAKKYGNLLKAIDHPESSTIDEINITSARVDDPVTGVSTFNEDFFPVDLDNYGDANVNITAAVVEFVNAVNTDLFMPGTRDGDGNLNNDWGLVQGEVENLTDRANAFNALATDITATPDERQAAYREFQTYYVDLAPKYNDAVNALYYIDPTKSGIDYTTYALGGVFNDDNTAVIIGDYSYGSYTDWVLDDGTALVERVNVAGYPVDRVPTSWNFSPGSYNVTVDNVEYTISPGVSRHVVDGDDGSQFTVTFPVGSSSPVENAAMQEIVDWIAAQ